MRGDTPHDVPTHLLKDADSYITGSGAFLRKTSLDELPQIYNILAGQMSVIGPRPALYNQYDLIEARDKVRANDIRPGLTGLAQVVLVVQCGARPDDAHLPCKIGRAHV